VNVLFGNTPFGYLSIGGAEIQLERTREALQRLGVSVKLYSSWDTTVLDGIDVVHWFHIDVSARPILRFARQRGARIVISAIFWPLRPWIDPLWTRITGLLGRIGIPLTSALASARETLGLADAVIASSRSEADNIHRVFSIPKEKIRIVPVAVSEDFLDQTPELFEKKYHLKDFILCVGRVEPRKNQLRLLRALRDVNIPVVFVGDHTLNPSYYQACESVGHPKAFFLGRMDHQDPLLRSAYAAAKVLAMPSLFETPGLVALEGALAGCRLVVTNRGNTREYFHSLVEYVDPHCVRSIREGILRAMDASNDRVQELRNLILREYSWDAVGKAIRAIYYDLVSV